MNLHQMKNIIIFMIKEYIFWLQRAEKVREQHKSSVRALSLSPVREDPSPVKVTSKTGKKRQGESNDSEKRRNIRPSEEIFNQYASQTSGYDSNLKENHRRCRTWILIRFKKLTINVKCPPPKFHFKCSKDYAKSYSRHSILGRGRGSLPKTSWKTRAASIKKF